MWNQIEYKCMKGIWHPIFKLDKNVFTRIKTALESSERGVHVNTPPTIDMRIFINGYKGQ